MNKQFLAATVQSLACAYSGETCSKRVRNPIAFATGVSPKIVQSSKKTTRFMSDQAEFKKKIADVEE